MSRIETATFGGGCFWCVEAVIQRLEGVKTVVPGYSGGFAPGKPTYREVCSGRTGHAEVIQVNFDNGIIDYKTLLTVFMTTHDPTTLNRQGADKGTQYRSVIYFMNPEQEKIAHELIQTLTPQFDTPIVTEVSPLSIFYLAEKKHHDYYNNNSNQGYCTVVISPKINKLRNSYAHLLKKNIES